MIRPAATLVVIRDGTDGLEVLLLRRNTKLSFIGGFWVFPGGAVDAEDCRAGEESNAEPPARRAALREAEEEAALRLGEDGLATIAHWTAPEGTPKRFATWFFLAEVDAEAPVEVDGGEIIEHRWMRPQQAIEARDRGELDILPPTYVTLEWLCKHPDSAAALEHFRQCRPVIFNPRFLIQGEDICNLYEGDAAYPQGDLDTPGPRHRFWMNKKAPWRYECEP